jgi:hypothetical protein
LKQAQCTQVTDQRQIPRGQAAEKSRQPVLFIWSVWSI